MYTIHDVARLSGVSIATVSAVVNKKSGVSPALTERVLKAVEALDYHPHQVARSLRVRRTMTIGMVIPDIMNPFYAEVVRGAQDETKNKGYSLILCDSNEDFGQEQSNLSTLYSRRVDGVLLAPTSAHAAQDRLTRRWFPIVFIDRIPPGFVGTAVITDNYLGAREATRHLISLGHKHIAIITGRLDLSNGIERLEGFRKALQEAGLPLRDDHLQRGDFQVQSGYVCGLNLLQSPVRPTAVFSCNNKMTLGLMQALNKMSVACPQNVSVVGFDDFEWSANFSPRLTTVAQPTREMGLQAMRVLLKRISQQGTPDNGKQDTVITLKPELRVRDSTAPPGP